MSDHNGAGIVLEKLPPAKTLIGDRGYDSNRFLVGGDLLIGSGAGT